MRERRIRPDGGRLFRGGGLIAPGGGLVRPIYAAAEPLAEYNFDEPLEQTLVTTGSTSVWHLQEPTGVYADTGIEGADLTVNGTPLRAQISVGHWRSSSMIARKAIEFTNQATEYLEVAAASTLDSDGTSVAIRVKFRCADATAGTILGKKPGAGGAGYWLAMDAAGQITASCHDGSSGVTATATGNHGDGAHHYAEIIIDLTADTIRVRTDLDTDSQDISGLGSLTNSDKFRIGFGNNDAAPQWLQLDYAAAIDGGVNAENMDSQAFWTHGEDPSGRLTTQTRNCVVSGQVADGYVCHYTINDVPTVWHTNFTTTNKLAAYFAPAQINRVPYSEKLSNWDDTNATVTDNQTNAPDGFLSASKILATAANGTTKEVFVSTAAKPWVVSVWIKESTVGCTGRVIFYDETGAAELDATAFVATGDWQLVEVIATTNAGQVSSSIRVEVDTDTESVFAWGAQGELGTRRGHYIRTDGAQAATVTSDFREANIFPTELGRYEAVCMSWSDLDTGQIVFSTEAIQDWRLLWFNVGETASQYFYNNVSASWSSIVGDSIVPGVLHEFIGRWDISDSGLFPEDADRSVSFHDNGALQGAATTSSAVADTARDLRIGVSYDGTSGFNGAIQRIRLYDAVGAEPT